MEGPESISSSVNAYTISSAISEGRRNFARSAESLAETNTPGFREYLASVNGTEETETAFPSLRPNADPNATKVGFEDNDFSTSDVIDLINPLQHIPVVGSIYRYASGDNDIKPSTQVLGDILYGGALGGALLGGFLSVSNAIIAQETGTAADQQIASAILGPSDDGSTQSETTALASAENVPGEAELASAATDKPLSDNVKTATLNNTASTGSHRLASNKFSGAGPNTNATAAAALAGAAAEVQAKGLKRQAFGGAMDTSATRNAALLKDNSGLTVVGSTIYPSHKFKSLSSVSKPSAARPLVSTTVKSETASAAKTDTNNAQESLDDPSQLGKVMHDSAERVTLSSQTGSKGNALPPELVRDMMSMALDKYKAADLPTATSENSVETTINRN